MHEVRVKEEPQRSAEQSSLLGVAKAGCSYLAPGIVYSALASAEVVEDAGRGCEEGRP